MGRKDFEKSREEEGGLNPGECQHLMRDRGREASGGEQREVREKAGYAGRSALLETIRGDTLMIKVEEINSVREVATKLGNQKPSFLSTCNKPSIVQYI